MMDATLTESSSLSGVEEKDAFRCKALSEPSGVAPEACFGRSADDDDMSSTERGVARADGLAMAAAAEGDEPVASPGLDCGSELRARCTTDNYD